MITLSATTERNRDRVDLYHVCQSSITGNVSFDRRGEVYACVLLAKRHPITAGLELHSMAARIGELEEETRHLRARLRQLEEGWGM